MKQNNKWYKTLYDWDKPGKVKNVECIEHSYTWSGKIRYCVLCGKKEND